MSLSLFFLRLGSFLLFIAPIYSAPPFEVLRSCIEEKPYNASIVINKKENGYYIDNPEKNCGEQFKVNIDNKFFSSLRCDDINYLLINDHKINLEKAENRSINPEIKPGILYPTDTSWIKIDFKNQSFLCLNGPISLSGTGSNIGQYYIAENAFSENTMPIIYYYFFNKDITPITSDHF